MRLPLVTLLVGLVGGAQGCGGADQAGAAVDGGGPGDAGVAVDAGAAVDAGVPSTPRGAVARDLVADGGRLVDVRTVGEFNAGHLAAARNLPLSELPVRLGELEPRDGWVVVYCASGGRSVRAAELLVDAGFPRVFDLGPMSAW